MLRIGIVGLPQTGKTTLFQILTHAHGSGIGSGRQEARVGVVRVPDARLDRLIEMFKPQKNVYATIEYMDMPGSVIELARTGVQSQALRELDALVHVVRAFEDEAVPMEEGSVDPKRDIENVELELILSDLAVVEKRLERLEKDIKKQKNPALEKEFQVLEGLQGGAGQADAAARAGPGGGGIQGDSRLYFSFPQAHALRFESG